MPQTARDEKRWGRRFRLPKSSATGEPGRRKLLPHRLDFGTLAGGAA
jgi:hypothetical protein